MAKYVLFFVLTKNPHLIRGKNKSWEKLRKGWCDILVLRLVLDNRGFLFILHCFVFAEWPSHLANVLFLGSQELVDSRNPILHKNTVISWCQGKEQRIQCSTPRDQRILLLSICLTCFVGYYTLFNHSINSEQVNWIVCSDSWWSQNKK